MGTHEDKRTVLYITIRVTKTYRYDVTRESTVEYLSILKSIKVNFSAFCNVMYQNLLRSRVYIIFSN